MYILALETTGAHASVAIINEDGKIVEKSSDSVLNHLQHLSRYEKARKNYHERSLWLAETGIPALDKLVEKE